MRLLLQKYNNNNESNNNTNHNNNRIDNMNRNCCQNRIISKRKAKTKKLEEKITREFGAYQERVRGATDSAQKNIGH